MKKNRVIFYSIFGFFHLASFIFTIILSSNSNLVFKMYKWVPSFKWVTLTGLILLVIDIIWSNTIQRRHENEKETLVHEMNVLKAKLFDLQEAAKKPSEPIKGNPPKA